jgi:hypothetical protein
MKKHRLVCALTHTGIALIGIALIGLPGGCGGTRGPQTSVLVDVTLPMGPEGVAYAFTIGEAMRVDVRVDLPCTLEGTAVIGPLYGAMRPHLVYEPDGEEDQGFAVKGSPGSIHSFELPKAGMYAVRIAGIPTAMGEAPPSIHVWVRGRALK